jgi:hypothetical protein
VWPLGRALQFVGYGGGANFTDIEATPLAGQLLRRRARLRQCVFLRQVRWDGDYQSPSVVSAQRRTRSLLRNSSAAPSFKTRVAAVGPQIGYLFPVGHMEGYINLKGYQEFAADNRPAGWIAWLTLSIAPKTPEAVVLGR